jgi:multiple sugar transport system ATP-binding protein|tara:strand:+ start:732 stop:998 length:267 start_codon:yes stop_codon:yes gene_type:complete
MSILKGVGKTFPDGTVAVKDVGLETDDGEFVVFVGPSGCGKTTLPRMIAGLEPIVSCRLSTAAGDDLTTLPERGAEQAFAAPNPRFQF